MTPGDDHWPPSEHPRLPLKEQPRLPACPKCAGRHDKPLPWCDQDNSGEYDGRD